MAKSSEEREEGRFTRNCLGRGVGHPESPGENLEESRWEEITKLGVSALSWNLGTPIPKLTWLLT